MTLHDHHLSTLALFVPLRELLVRRELSLRLLLLGGGIRINKVSDLRRSETLISVIGGDDDESPIILD